MSENEAKSLVEWFLRRKGKELKLNNRGVDCVIEALGKQISAKPITEHRADLEDEYLYCPNCGEILTDRIPFNPKTFYFHCLNCG